MLPDHHVELILRDEQTGAPLHVLQLTVKLSDFGLAQPLDLDASHLSITGHAGTIKYMAPETFRPSADGVQRLSKQVDVWALGVMLFQMLHKGRTPYDRYCLPKNVIGGAVAIASEFIHKQVMKFERREVWAAERKMLVQDLRDRNTDHAKKKSRTAVSLLSTEILFRMCERCLAFEVSDRPVGGEDLIRWMEHFADRLAIVRSHEQTMASESDHSDDVRAVEALLSGVSVEGEDAPVSTGDQAGRRSSLCKLNEKNLVQQGGERIELVFFPELQWAGGASHWAGGASHRAGRAGRSSGLEEHRIAQEELRDSAVVNNSCLPPRGETTSVVHVAPRYSDTGGCRVVANNTSGGCELELTNLVAQPTLVEQRERRRGSDVVLVRTCRSLQTGEESEGSSRGQAVVRLPGAVEEEREDTLQIAALLPLNEEDEDCGGAHQGRAEDARSEQVVRRARPEMRLQSSMQQSPGLSCGCKILGIIGIAFTVLAAGLVFMLVPKLTGSPPGDFLKPAEGPPSGVVDFAVPPASTTGSGEPPSTTPTDPPPRPPSPDHDDIAEPISFRPANSLETSPSTGTASPTIAPTRTLGRQNSAGAGGTGHNMLAATGNDNGARRREDKLTALRRALQKDPEFLAHICNSALARGKLKLDTVLG